MDIYIAPDPSTAGTWVLDDYFHFLGGCDDDHRALALGIARSEAAAAGRSNA